MGLSALDLALWDALGQRPALPLTALLGVTARPLTYYWSPSPYVIGNANDQLLKAAKIKGALVWHAHDQEDELFHVVKGSMRIELEDGVVELREGDFLTIPKGVRHNPVADEECWILLIESTSTKHTGN